MHRRDRDPQRDRSDDAGDDAEGVGRPPGRAARVLRRFGGPPRRTWHDRGGEAPTCSADPHPHQPSQVQRVGPLIGPPKSEAGRRTITVPAAIIDDLRHHLDICAQPGSEGYVVTGDKGGPVTPHMLQSNWNRARREVGIEHIHLHDLRHLAGTLAASTGARTKELMYRLGHASPQAALRYQHATRERDVAIADAIDRLIGMERRDGSTNVIA